jgi:hypothetical protein
MKFSLIVVDKTRNNGHVDGSWVQDHVGTVESATRLAIDTEKVNGNKVDIAVVNQLYGDLHGDPYRIDLKRLDLQRIEVAP